MSPLSCACSFFPSVHLQVFLCVCVAVTLLVDTDITLRFVAMCQELIKETSGEVTDSPMSQTAKREIAEAFLLTIVYISKYPSLRT